VEPQKKTAGEEKLEAGEKGGKAGRVLPFPAQGNNKKQQRA
jgi:hypothetical protein